MIYHFKSLVLVRKGRAFYATLYQEVFFGNPGGGGSLNKIFFMEGWDWWVKGGYRIMMVADNGEETKYLCLGGD